MEFSSRAIVSCPCGYDIGDGHFRLDGNVGMRCGFTKLDSRLWATGRLLSIQITIDHKCSAFISWQIRVKTKTVWVEQLYKHFGSGVIVSFLFVVINS